MSSSLCILNGTTAVIKHYDRDGWMDPKGKVCLNERRRHLIIYIYGANKQITATESKLNCHYTEQKRS